MRAKKSLTSSSPKALTSDSMGTLWRTFLNPLDGCRAKPVAGAVGALQVGKPHLDGLVAYPQRVVVRIGDLRRIALIVKAVVVGDLPRQPLQLGGSFVLAQLLDGFPGGVRR